ncbi:branched-chain amino acid transporter permease [Velocimicrobium porci]|uniref:Branched-chain amino acid transporter AzlD n=1 Tax=Velocimicrobium porci TaxID=2606634 RepID=A0A6L5XVH5_9FIRM|nr:AzlD domain-containing protein [Velocimicrobium porci]MSS62368.1 branched-chain amino acid transporter AzlD [Velocimicrobium porci]
MNVDTNTVIGIIALCAVVTFGTRVLPFLCFGGKRKVPEAVTYLGKVLPPAIIITLIVYCIRTVDFTVAPRGIPEFVAIGIVAVLHVWKRNNLLSIGVGTACYMILVQAIF